MTETVNPEQNYYQYLECIGKEKAIEHFGVKGMKWGIRKDKKSGRTRSSDSKELSRIKKKRISEMTNEELATANKRLGLERNFKNLDDRMVSRGKKIVDSVFLGVASTLLTGAIMKGGKTLFEVVKEKRGG